MRVMLKIKLALQSTTLPNTKLFSHHEVGICRDHTKDTSGIEAKHNVSLLFCTVDNMQKAGNGLKWWIINDFSTLDNANGKSES